jgi:hypothetical protein
MPDHWQTRDPRLDCADLCQHRELGGTQATSCGQDHRSGLGFGALRADEQVAGKFRDLHLVAFALHQFLWYHPATAFGHQCAGEDPQCLTRGH